MHSRMFATAALATLMACSSDPVSGPGAPATLAVVSGGTNSAGRVILESADRVDTVVVRATDAQGRPVPGVSISWTTDDPDAAITPLAESSDADGVVRAEWRLSGAPGTWKARAMAGDLSAVEASFTVTSWSVKHAVVVGATTCVQSHDDRLWCRASDTEPFTPQRGGGTIRSLEGSLGVLATDRQVCVIDAPGTIRCAATANTPLDFAAVPGQSVPFRALALAAMGRTHCALDVAGGVWCWGDRQGGRLGDGTVGAGLRAEVGPVDVPAGVQFMAVTVDGDNACALAEDGTPWCWGRATTGAVWPVSNQTVTTPRAVAVPGPLASLAIPQLGSTVCGLTADRGAVCWGASIGFARTGTSGSEAPTLLPGLVDAVDLVPMPDGFLALRSKGELMGWGDFYFGHVYGPGDPGPLDRGTGIRARALYRGIGLQGRTCIDDAAGKGTVCGATRDLAAPIDVGAPLLWTGLVKPAGAN